MILWFCPKKGYWIFFFCLKIIWSACKVTITQSCKLIMLQLCIIKSWYVDAFTIENAPLGKVMDCTRTPLSHKHITHVFMWQTDELQDQTLDQQSEQIFHVFHKKKYQDVCLWRWLYLVLHFLLSFNTLYNTS